MKLFLLRHGMTSRADSDGDRSLTEDGIAALKEVMGRRADEMRNVVRVFTGPLGRIQESAAIASEVIGFKGEIEVSQRLTKLSRAQEIIPEFENVDMEGGDIMLVSHESSLCNLMLWLTLEDILMSNSSLSAIETKGWTRAAGDLLWQESPNSRDIKRTSAFVDQF